MVSDTQPDEKFYMSFSYMSKEQQIGLAGY